MKLHTRNCPSDKRSLSTPIINSILVHRQKSTSKKGKIKIMKKIVGDVDSTA